MTNPSTYKWNDILHTLSIWNITEGNQQVSMDSTIQDKIEILDLFDLIGLKVIYGVGIYKHVDIRK